MPAPLTAKKNSRAIRYASGASSLARGIINPIWRGIQMIVDPYTAAKKGQRIITGIMMTGWDMVDDSALSQLIPFRHVT